MMVLRVVMFFQASKLVADGAETTSNISGNLLRVTKTQNVCFSRAFSQLTTLKLCGQTTGYTRLDQRK